MAIVAVIPSPFRREVCRLGDWCADEAPSECSKVMGGRFMRGIHFLLRPILFECSLLSYLKTRPVANAKDSKPRVRKVVCLYSLLYYERNLVEAIDDAKITPDNTPGCERNTEVACKAEK